MTATRKQVWQALLDENIIEGLRGPATAGAPCPSFGKVA